MTAQLTLLDWSPGARATDPDTSHRAAARNPLRRNSDRWRVLIAHSIYHPVGLTDFDLEVLTGIKQTSAGKRRCELRDMGLIRATEMRRPAPSGSPAIVWIITADGLAVARAVA